MRTPRTDVETAETLAPDADPIGTADTQAAATTSATTGEPSVGGLTREEAGRYVVRSEIGRGGMGRVVAVVDRHLGRDVAMKELLEASTGAGIDVGAIARFVREARVTGQLEHPSIVPVHELGQRADGTLYYTMKRIRGRSLASVLRDTRDTQKRLSLVSTFRDVCQAIAYAHSRGVVHRDLKPDNVMVGEFGETLVVDWGIAKIREEASGGAGSVERRLQQNPSAGETVDGHAIGTPAYMSPEQARGDLTAIDERSDVWGLGAILFEILTGRPPFEGETAMAVLTRVLTDAPPRVRDVAPETPPEIAAIADRALRRERSERYASARELADEIAAWQDGRAVAAYQYSSWEIVRRFVRRHRAATIAAGAVAASLVIASAFMYRSYRNERRERAGAERAAAEALRQRERAVANEFDARVALAQALLERAQRAVASGDPASAAIYAAAVLMRDPTHRDSAQHDGSHARTVSQRHEDEERYARALSTYLDAEESRGYVYERTVHGEPSTQGLISPSGARFALPRHDGLQVVDLASGASAIVPIDEPARVLAWVDDDHVVLRAREPGVYDVRTGVRTYPLASPTSATLRGNDLYVANFSGSIAVHDAATGAERRRFETGRHGVVRLALHPTSDGLLVCSNDSPVLDRWEAGAVAPLAPIVLPGVVRIAAYSPDGVRIAVATAGSDITFVDAARPDDRRVLRTEGWVHGLTWLGPDELLFLQEDDAVVFVPSEDRALEVMRGGVGATTSLSYVGNRLGVGVDGLWRFFRRLPSRHAHTIVLDENVMTLLGESTRGELLAVGGRSVFAIPREGTTWGTPVLRGRLPDGDNSSSEAALAVDGAIAITTTRGTAFLIEPGQAPTMLFPATPSLPPETFAVAFDPRGDTVFIGPSDKASSEIRRYSRSRHAVLPPLRGHTRGVYGLSVSRDGHWLVSAGGDGDVRQWDLTVEPPQVVRTLRGHARLAGDAAFAPDGRRIATTDGEGGVRMFDATSGALIASATPHGTWVNHITWSDDGRLLATASDDGTSRVLDAGTLRTVRIVRNSGSSAWALLADGGRTLISHDGRRVRATEANPAFDRADPAALLERAERAAGLRLEGLDLRVAD